MTEKVQVPLDPGKTYVVRVWQTGKVNYRSVPSALLGPEPDDNSAPKTPEKLRLEYRS